MICTLCSKPLTSEPRVFVAHVGAVCVSCSVGKIPIPAIPTPDSAAQAAAAIAAATHYAFIPSPRSRWGRR